MQFLSQTNIDFLKWRWHALALSAVVIGAGLFTMATRGMPVGIDFSGGTAVVVQFPQPVSEDAVRDALASLPGDKIVQQYGDPLDHQVLVRLPLTEEAEANLEQGAAEVLAALRARLGDLELLSTDIVGPVIGEDLKRKGIWATLFALGGILVYIGLRFRFTFALGAIAAVFHDILVTLTMLTWFNYEMSLNVIAAILAITGYSVNDTIVIFDRVRENQRMARREPIRNLINRSVNQTLSRTIITSGTTLVAVVTLFLLGGEVLRGFSFTMMVGILTGTYSTVFIASAVAVVLNRPTPQAASQAQARARRARV
ncbi:MAG TPA: protein translocase subunit SecF [Vicinamibacterales bacterium]|nr:protein translocase subunit SecF [Vicinamibacterales bacterium]